MLVRGDLTDQEGSTTQVVIITNCLQYIYSKNTAKAGMEKNGAMEMQHSYHFHY